MEQTVSTALRALLQLNQYLGIAPTVLTNSTLNQKFSVQSSATPTSSEVPTLQYICAGINGRSISTGSDGIALTIPNQHQPREAALFKHIPWLVREITNDLDATTRADYRLRAVETYGSTQYACYYAKVMDLSDVTPSLVIRTIDDETGDVTETAYTPTASDLSPTPTSLSEGQSLVASGDYIAATAKITVTLSSSDMEEFANACEIIMGDENYAVISEIAICTGADRTVTATINSVSTSYAEVIACQVASFISTEISAITATSGASLTFDVGNVEPLLTLSTS